MWKYALLILLSISTLHASAQKPDSIHNKRNIADTLKEVVVSTKVAVKVKGDTVSYTVDSLTKNPNATVEDILKKLPGVEITSEGKIMVNGKEVTKLFLNGKIYNADDLRTLTQNLPAEILEKLQLADWYDEDAQFTGIKKGSTEKMLNLKIKKEYERGVYGQAIAGLGTKNTYQAGTFSNYMSHDTRITFIGKVNNTGLADVGITDRGNADNTRASTPNATGITERKVADLSFSNDKGKKLKLSGNYNAWVTDNTQQQTSLRNTYLPGDSSLLQQQKRDIRNNSNNHRLNARSDWTIDSMLSMQTDAGLSYRKNKSNSVNNDGTYYNTTDNVNFTRQSDISSLSEGYGLNIGNTLRKKFRKQRRTAVLDLGGSYNKDESSGDNYNLNEYFAPASTNRNDYVSADMRKSMSTRAGLTYNEPLGKWHTITLGYNNKYSLSESDRKVSKINNDIRTPDTLQTREYDTHNTEHNLKFNYQFRNERVRTSLEMLAVPFSRDVMQQGYTSKTVLTQTGVNYFPSFFTNYTFKSDASIYLNYTMGIRKPEITQLQVIPDYRDSLNIVLGNANLKPETSNNININFNSSSKEGKRNAWITANGNWSYNKVVNKTEINASKRVTMPINADGYYNAGFNAGYYYKIAKWIAPSISGSAGISNNIVITNGVQQNIPNQYLAASAKLVLTGGEWYEGDIVYNFNINSLQNSTGETNVLQKHTITATGLFTIPWGIRFIYYLNYIHNEGLTAAYNPDFILVNATVEKAFTKPRGLVIRAQGFDVFNNYPNVQRTFGDNYYEDRGANRLGRFFIFSLVYKFRYFPSSGK